MLICSSCEILTVVLMKIQVICIQKTRNLHPFFKFIRVDINIESVINRIKGWNLEDGMGKYTV